MAVIAAAWAILLLGYDHVRAPLALEVGERSAGFAGSQPHEDVQAAATGGTGPRFSLRRCHPQGTRDAGRSLRHGRMPPAHGEGGVRGAVVVKRWLARPTGFEPVSPP